MALTAEQLAEAKALLTTATNGHAPGMPEGWTAPAPIAPSGWGAPAAPAPASFAGPEKILVPLKLQAPGGGTVRIYFQFAGEMAANPQALLAAIGHLATLGLPIDVWMPKQNGWGGGGYRNGNGGGGGGWGGGQRGGW